MGFEIGSVAPGRGSWRNCLSGVRDDTALPQGVVATIQSAGGRGDTPLLHGVVATMHSSGVCSDTPLPRITQITLNHDTLNDQVGRALMSTSNQSSTPEKWHSTQDKWCNRLQHSKGVTPQPHITEARQHTCAHGSTPQHSAAPQYSAALHTAPLSAALQPSALPQHTSAHASTPQTAPHSSAALQPSAALQSVQHSSLLQHTSALHTAPLGAPLQHSAALHTAPRSSSLQHSTSVQHGASLRSPSALYLGELLCENRAPLHALPASHSAHAQHPLPATARASERERHTHTHTRTNLPTDLDALPASHSTHAQMAHTHPELDHIPLTREKRRERRSARYLRRILCMFRRHRHTLRQSNVHLLRLSHARFRVPTPTVP